MKTLKSIKTLSRIILNSYRVGINPLKSLRKMGYETSYSINNNYNEHDDSGIVFDYFPPKSVVIFDGLEESFPYLRVAYRGETSCVSIEFKGDDVWEEVWIDTFIEGIGSKYFRCFD